MSTTHDILVKMAEELTAKGRNQIKEKNFAIPEKEKYPINDMAHARNALARVSQFGTEQERKEVREKVYRRYPSLREEFEQRHGTSPLKKDVLKKKMLGDVNSTSKEAQLMAQAMITATKVAATLPPQASDATIKTAASQLMRAYYLGRTAGGED